MNLTANDSCLLVFPSKIVYGTVFQYGASVEYDSVLSHAPLTINEVRSALIYPKSIEYSTPFFIRVLAF